jgi:hypothetical protein
MYFKLNNYLYVRQGVCKQEFHENLFHEANMYVTYIASFTKVVKSYIRLECHTIDLLKQTYMIL